jgi:hypothetical protein
MPESEMPFNVFGDYRDGEKYNYVDFATGDSHMGNKLYINDVKVSRVGSVTMESKRDFDDVNPEIYTAIIDFEVRFPRFPRANC